MSRRSYPSASARPPLLTFAYLHLSENDVPDPGVPFVDNAPAPVAHHNFYGLASDRVSSEVNIGTILVKHDFGGAMSLSNILRYANYDFNYQFEIPPISEAWRGAVKGTPSAEHTARHRSCGPGCAGRRSGTQTNLTDEMDFVGQVSRPVSSVTP